LCSCIPEQQIEKIISPQQPKLSNLQLTLFFYQLMLKHADKAAPIMGARQATPPSAQPVGHPTHLTFGFTLLLHAMDKHKLRDRARKLC
jgi:hypothetical protein